MRLQKDGKATYMRRLFSSVASEYEWLLALLSFRQDAFWRRAVVEKASIAPGSIVLDVATGTGLLARELVKATGPSGRVVGIDISARMLRHGHARDKKTGTALYVVGRAESLPFRGNTFNCVTIGLALRNVSRVSDTFGEMLRVTRHGGKILSLDFTTPKSPAVRIPYFIYLSLIMPQIGGLISASWKETLNYLSRSIKNSLMPLEIQRIMKRIGLVETGFLSLSKGIVALVSGTKPIHARPNGKYA